LSPNPTEPGRIPPGETAAAPEIRRDPISGRVVLIAPERSRRPGGYVPGCREAFPGDELEDCPFCPGHEGRTPPEIAAVRPAGSFPNEPGWRVRVIPNKYPALVPGTATDGGEPARGSRSMGMGAHEVVIETDRHELEPIDLPDEDAALAWAIIRNRVRALEASRAHAYVQVFKNRGREAGASLRHPHTQIAALPFVPPRLAEELGIFADHAARQGGCLLCRHLESEIICGERIVLRSRRYAVWAPFGSCFPFELRLAPLSHLPSLAGLTDEDCLDLATCLRLVLRIIRSRLGDPDYNLVLQQAPSEGSASFHWRLDILPALVRTAGFEWGTGVHINPVAPEAAAALLGPVPDGAGGAGP
jgi:UDPglucose--hexose-1-phosphate uridylyltransferase